MNKKQEPDADDLAQAIHLAQSPEGQQLLNMLKQNDSGQLQKAMEKANNGDYSQAKEAINAFLSTTEAKALLEKLGGNP